VAADALPGLNLVLERELRGVCPAFMGIVRPEGGRGLCFWAIENSKGFADPTIQALAGAIGAVVQGLPALQQQVLRILLRILCFRSRAHRRIPPSQHGVSSHRNQASRAPRTVVASPQLAPRTIVRQVPLRWLRVHDELRRRAEDGAACVSLGEVQGVALRCELPHTMG
jgi:hypothetical protein